MRENFLILNGRIENDDDYQHDFHCLQYENILKLYILLPGININSLLIKVEGSKLKIRARIMREFQIIYRDEEIRLTGMIPNKVYEKTYKAEYTEGILIISLSLMKKH